VNQRAITVKVADANKVYGDADPTLTTCALTSGSMAYADALTGACDTSRELGQNVGTYAVSANSTAFSVGSPSNYQITLVDGILSITKATLTVSVANASKTYGQADPTNAFTVVGLKMAKLPAM